MGLLLGLLGLLGIVVFHHERGKSIVRQPLPGAGNATSNPGADRSRTQSEDPAKALESFDAWRQSYLQASAADRPALLAQGVVLADARRNRLAGLARQDPAQAIDHLLSLAELAELPAPVRAACEQPLSTIGSIDLQWNTRVKGDETLECQHQSVAFAGDRSWRVNGPAYLDAKPPRAGVPIDGHVIDGELLVATHPIRKLDAANLAAASKTFPQGNADGLDPVTGNPAGPDSAALIGGKIFRFENDSVIDQVIARLAEADQRADQTQVFKPETGFKWLEADGGTGSGTGDSPVGDTPFLVDNIDVLFIRVDFSDKPGAAASQADLQTSLTSTNGHLQNYSYGAASIIPTVTSQLYRMPSPSTTYTSNTSSGSAALLTAARSLAAANYTLANYDVVAVNFPALTGTDFGYAGRASVGGADHWMNGLISNSSRISVLLHEFGHNYGLNHANYYDPGQQIGGSYAGPGSVSLEYGDVFDRMGSADPAEGYFNPFATSRLNWLPTGKIAQATGNGTWRIYRFDAATALTNPLIALRVPMGGNEYWWVGHRRLFAALSNSAYVVAEGIYTNRPNLIDMTPGSLSPESNDRSDAGLPVGRQFYDPAKGVTFRTLASGGTEPNQWIDVQLEFDSRIQLAKTTVEVDEQAGSAVLTVSRTFGTTGVATVNYATANGTATAGSDYYAVSGSVTWADGDAADKQILVPLRPDAVNDGGETFTFTLSGASGATLVATQSVATVTLRDAGQRLTAFTADFFNQSVNAIAPLASGKVLIGGFFNTGILGNIARLNADGTYDSTFIKGTGFDGDVKSIVVQSNGQILVGGAFSNYNGTPCNRLVRLSADGAVDTAFVTAMGVGANATVSSIAIETTGKILVGGDFTTFAGGTMEGLVRLTALGARDTVSPLTLPFVSGWATSINAIIAQDDGKIMAAGSFYIAPDASGFHSGIARLSTNGSRDTSFDPDAGLHLAGTTNNLQTGYAIIRQPDGKYVVGGDFTAYNGNSVPRLARVNSNGSFDSSFVPPANDYVIDALLLQPSGALVVGGWKNSSPGYFERLLASGAEDPTFRQGTGPSGSVYALAGDSDGALWLGGNFFAYDGVSVWPMVKLAGGVSAYDAWLTRTFTAAQISAGIADPGDDPDLDGIQNIAEMALATSPTAANPTNPFAALAGSTGLVTHGPAAYLKSTFTHSAANPGVWVTAQFSSGLGPWLPANPLPGANATYDILEDTATRFTVRDKTPANGATPTRFVRFVVRKPE